MAPETETIEQIINAATPPEHEGWKLLIDSLTALTEAGELEWLASDNVVATGAEASLCLQLETRPDGLLRKDNGSNYCSRFFPAYDLCRAVLEHINERNIVRTNELIERAAEEIASRIPNTAREDVLKGNDAPIDTLTALIAAKVKEKLRDPYAF